MRAVSSYDARTQEYLAVTGQLKLAGQLDVDAAGGGRGRDREKMWE